MFHASLWVAAARSNGMGGSCAGQEPRRRTHIGKVKCGLRRPNLVSHAHPVGQIEERAKKLRRHKLHEEAVGKLVGLSSHSRQTRGGPAVAQAPADQSLSE